MGCSLEILFFFFFFAQTLKMLLICITMGPCCLPKAASQECLSLSALPFTMYNLPKHYTQFHRPIIQVALGLLKPEQNTRLSLRLPLLSHKTHLQPALSMNQVRLLGKQENTP